MSNEALEITGKSLEEALEHAAAELGVPREEVEYELIGEPKKILGVLGAGHYTVRAWRSGEKPAGAAAGPEESESRSGRPTPEDVARKAQEITRHLFSLINMEATVEIVSADREGVRLDIKSPMSQGLFIGRHGETLDALQFLVGVGANEGEHGGYRVTLDMGGYRKRQEEALRQMALETAAQAVESGQEAVIPGLKPYERRIVHTALAGRDDVTTYSEGEGEQRQIVISPLAAASADEQAPSEA